MNAYVTIPQAHFHGKQHCSKCSNVTDQIIKFLSCDRLRVNSLTICGVCHNSEHKRFLIGDWNNLVPENKQLELNV